MSQVAKSTDTTPDSKYTIGSKRRAKSQENYIKIVLIYFISYPIIAVIFCYLRIDRYNKRYWYNNGGIFDDVALLFD